MIFKDTVPWPRKDSANPQRSGTIAAGRQRHGLAHAPSSLANAG